MNEESLEKIRKWSENHENAGQGIVFVRMLLKDLDATEQRNSELEQKHEAFIHELAVSVRLMKEAREVMNAAGQLAAETKVHLRELAEEYFNHANWWYDADTNQWVWMKTTNPTWLAKATIGWLEKHGG